MNPKLSPEQVTLFQDQGFFIVEDFFTQDEVVAVRDEITAIINRYPDVPDELVQIEPTVLKGEFEPESVEFGVRKLFRMTRHNDFFKKI